MIERLLIALGAVAIYDWWLKPALERRRERREQHERFLAELLSEGEDERQE
jgi:hypothetical protein